MTLLGLVIRNQKLLLSPDITSLAGLVSTSAILSVSKVLRSTFIYAQIDFVLLEIDV